MAVINYAIEITTDDGTGAVVNQTDATIGLYAGYFRWVTGRPSYDGSTVVPSVPGGDTALGGNVWKNNILTEGSLGNPSRAVDIVVSGSYGNLSDFEFSVDNTNVDFSDMFWKAVQNYAINFINRKVKFYVVIDNVFYIAWVGYVINEPYDDLRFDFKCKDRMNDPIFPPETFNKAKFPDLKDRYDGKVLPVSLGYVPYNIVTPVPKTIRKLALGVINKVDVLTSGIGSYSVSSSSDAAISVYTPFATFEADQFSGGTYYLNIVKGQKQAVLISGNLATSGSGISAFTVFKLATPLDLGGAAVSDIDYDTTPQNTPTITTAITSSAWYVELFELKFEFLLSSSDIQAASSSSLGKISTFAFINDQYNDISFAVDSIDLTSSNAFGSPTIVIFVNDVDATNNDLTLYIPITPEDIEVLSISVDTGTIVLSTFPSTGSATKLFDLDRTTNYKFIASLNQTITLQILLKLPTAKTLVDFEKLYVLFDAKVTNALANDATTTAIKVYTIDYLNNTHQKLLDDGVFFSVIGGDTETFNVLPNSYYKNGNDNSESSIFSRLKSGSETYKDATELDSTKLGNIKDAVPYKGLLIQFTHGELTIGPSPVESELLIKQVGFVGSKTINILEDNLYVRVKGEKDGSTFVDSVPRVFTYLLETYGGIPSGDITQVNIGAASTRGDWYIGRQITEAKKLFEYIDEICKQSMVAAFPGRKGDIRLKAWRDDTAAAYTDTDATNVNDDTIDLTYTPLDLVYNTFLFKYDWDPAREKYNKSINVAKVNEAATFPGQYVSTGTDTTGVIGSGGDFNPASVISAVLSGPATAIEFALANDPSWEIGSAVSIVGNPFLTGYFSIITSKSISGGSVFYYLNDSTKLGFGFSIATIHHHTTTIPKWATYANGFTQDLYVEAKDIWDTARASYVKTLNVNPLPEEYAESKWYIDREHFPNDDQSALGAVYKFATEIIQWASRRKAVIKYRIPITTSNITRELLDVVSFTGKIHTDNSAVQGWITEITIIPETDEIEIELIINPSDIEGPCDTITETGLATDTYTESGSQTDTLTEGAC